VEKFLHLVRYNAERIYARLPDEVDIEDLMSVRPVRPDGRDRRLRPRPREVKFETYCAPRIRGAILDELRSMDWVPRLVRHRSGKVEGVRQQIEMETGRKATDDEIAERLSSTTRSSRSTAATARRSGHEHQPQGLLQSDGYRTPRDRRHQGRRADDPVKLLQRRDLKRADHQGPEPGRAAHRHPLLLRGHDDEGDRRDARPLREPRQPDALVDPRPLKAQMQHRMKELEQGLSRMQRLASTLGV
jgi:RNA polymerase sigma factor for flagellar operon FliA